MKKKILTLLIASLAIMGQAFAAAPLAKMYSGGGGVVIEFNDFANAANSFETYECNIDFGSWIYTLAAVKDGDLYKCTDQGSLQSGVDYSVHFTFENFQDYKAQSATFNLKAN